MKFLLILTILSVVAVAYSVDFECESGKPYKKNYCNTCFCGIKSHEVHWGCTKRFCHTDANLLNCEVGTTWMNDCNRCWCVSNRNIYCEKKKCVNTDHDSGIELPVNQTNKAEQ